MLTLKEKTVDVKGAKEVVVINPAGEKDSFTVTLALAANGDKCPAVVVFKGYCKNGEISEKTLNGLVVPDNVVVKSSGPA